MEPWVIYSLLGLLVWLAIGWYTFINGTCMALIGFTGKLGIQGWSIFIGLIVLWPVPQVYYGWVWLQSKFKR